MHVQDIMTRNPVTAHPGDTVAQALELMREGGFHHLPIVATSGHLVGIVTTRDCRVGLNLADIDEADLGPNTLAHQVKLRQIMSTAPIVTPPEMDIFSAAMLMYENGINSLPVMLDETLIGIVTSSDLLIASMQIARRALKA